MKKSPKASASKTTPSPQKSNSAGTKKAATRSKKSSPFVELDDETSVDSWHSSYASEDGEEEFPVFYFIGEPSDKATKVALRISYAAMLAQAFAVMMQLSATKFDSSFARMQVATVSCGIAFSLIAAAQSNYDAQRRAIQYFMTWLLFNDLVKIASGIQTLEEQAASLALIALNMVRVGVPIFVVCFKSNCVCFLLLVGGLFLRSTRSRHGGF